MEENKTKLKKIKNFIFDWSGTLSDDYSIVYDVSMMIFDYFRIPHISKEQYRKEFKLPYMDFWNMYLPELGIEEERKLFDKCYAEYFDKHGHPKPIPGSIDIITKMYEKGYRLYVLSSCTQVNLEAEAEHYGVRECFDGLYGSVHNKTVAMQQIIESLALKPEETTYIGDMTHDIESARKNNVLAVAVLTGYQNKETLEKESPDMILESVEELNNLLD